LCATDRLIISLVVYLYLKKNSTTITILRFSIRVASETEDFSNFSLKHDALSGGGSI